jgi:hypothetical protein
MFQKRGPQHTAIVNTGPAKQAPMGLKTTTSWSKKVVQMFKKIAAVAVGVASLAAAGTSIAQNFNLQPLYGTVRLVTGFLPDPRVVPVRAGGSIDASDSIGGQCRGFITNRPSIRVWYTAGDTYPLIISANSQADTTLAINAPDGRWYCDDDSGNGPLNPSVRFRRPMSGRYEVFVGTYRPEGRPGARVYISELHSR